MKIFLVGLEKSGKTAIASALSEYWDDCIHVSAFDWVRSTFREPYERENPDEYRQEFNLYITERMKLNRYLFVDNVCDILEINNNKNKFLIDGVNSPKDFIHLFNYNEDVVIFLNRVDGPDYIEGHDQLNVNIIRDYCLWLSNRGLLTKKSWLEFNFPIPGDPQDTFVKKLRNKNSVFITRSINQVINLLKEEPWNSET